MHYYLVWVRSARYHGSEPLTYSSTERLKTGRIVQVELQNEAVMGVIAGVTTRPRFKTKDITRIYDLPPLPSHLIRLSNWLMEYYPAPLGIVAQQLLPANLSEKQLDKPSEIKFTAPDLRSLPILTKEQSEALQAMDQTDTYLLHGATGSGKTRLYIEMAAMTTAAGRSSIILTPEISLTSQLAGNFRQVFGERVIVVHSQQAPAERQKAWLNALRVHEPVIVIGPRSALFSPVQKPGLIILDEAHEGAYKQEQAPQYQAGRVASYLAQITRSSLILGSATPLVSDYYLAEAKNKPIIRLKELARKDLVTEVKISLVDRKDHSLFSRSPLLSQELIQAVEQALKRGEQSLLYLNRRGTARLVLCSNCGWQAACPHCDVPLTYHGDSHSLRCHSCNWHDKAPTNCPNCGHPEVIFKTAGTKAIAAEIERLFPKVKVGRYDTDNLRAERFEQHYEAVKAGSVDVLVGTQLLAKGLDLPKLSTLGIVLADTSLYMPDFSAQERTFQLISQVLGRVGRGHVAGRAVIQTYHPDNPILQAAIKGDYETFYKAELAERRQFLFPPFVYLLKLSVRRASIKSAQEAAEKLREELAGYKVRVEGPAPSFYERFQNKYQWQLVVKSKDRGELLKIIAALPAGWSYDIDPMDLL
jgi:primosomal protein N' (replication factor Y) (superfamily II helicase)